MKAETSTIKARRTYPFFTIGKGLCLWLTLFIMLLPSMAQAGSLQLENMVLDNQAGSIMARFGIELTSDTQIEEALHNGIKLKLICEASLYEHKSVWLDSKVAGKTYSNKLYFDSLSNQFVIEKEDSDKIFKNNSLSILLRDEWKSIILDLGPWSTLQRGEQYNLRLKVRLDRTEVPAWLKNTLFFWSWDLIPAATYQLNFTY
ncbi:DUF4390 domain-containing protein [Maridesulfovibrio sp.]|uniref:DUF4390 domain-containing protein n=1 Tax=Maridesulfovibrio sp. TaxID=2795000 RepID=UPI0029CA5E5E|nr:DUF4390 domain-containing protein [Maridesulfovibrio sp.]